MALEDLARLFEAQSQAQGLERIGVKYGPLASAGVPGNVLGPLARLDWRRIQAGQQPYSATQTMAMLVGALRGRTTPSPEKGFWGRIGEDVRGLTSGILQLPFTLAREVKELPTAPARVAEARAAGQNQIAALAQAPGLRMLPGAFTVGSIASGHPEELARHPIYTILDVLPYASRAARLTAPGRAAAEAGRSPLVALGQSGYEALERPVLERFPQVRPYSPKAVWNRLPFGGMARSMMEVFSPKERLAQKEAQRWASRVHEELKGFNIPIDRARELWYLARRGDPGWRAALSPEEGSMVRRVEELQREWDHLGQTPDQMFMWDGELYSREQSHSLWKRHEAYRRAEENWFAESEWNQEAQAAELRGEKPPPKPFRRPYDKTYRAKGITTWEQAAAFELDTFEKLVAKTPPARFAPRIAEDLRSSITNIIRENGGTDADWARAVDYAQGGFYNQVPGLSRREFNAMVRDAKASWQGMKAEGINPMWVHHVGERGVPQVRYPRLMPERDITPSSLKRRGLDLEPSVPSFAISLQHQGIEWIMRQHADAAFNAFQEAGLLKPRAQVEREVVDQARLELGLKGDDLSQYSSESFRAKVAQVLKRDWTEVDRDSIFPFRSPKVQAAGPSTERFMMPKAAASAVEMLRRPPGAIARAGAKPLKVFRISVLALSPTYYVNNLLGDSLMLMGRTSPLAFRHVAEAYRMLKADTVPADLVRGLAHLPKEQVAWDMAVGRKLADMVPERNWFRMAELINDVGRVTSYLEGKTKAARAGKSVEAAHAAGLELANKVFQNWDTMTPIERVAIRGLIPFYSFTRYVLRYAMTFPFDHPVRAAIVSNFARAEQEDWRKGGLPADLMNLLFLGHPDEQGNVKAISGRGLNPFYDVATLGSLAGWVSKVNPIIGGVLRKMGVDPSSGPELYPELDYDEATGALKARGGSWWDVLGGFVPQTRFIEGLLSHNQELRQLKIRDPEAFKRYLLSGLRVSSLYPTSYNLFERKGKAEMMRFDELREALSALTNRGETSKLERYPELAAQLEALAGTQARS